VELILWSVIIRYASVVAPQAPFANHSRHEASWQYEGFIVIHWNHDVAYNIGSLQNGKINQGSPHHFPSFPFSTRVWRSNMGELKIIFVKTHADSGVASKCKSN
jgi:hypothetical protein